MRNKEYYRPRICPRADDYDSGDEREQQIISRAIDKIGPVALRSALSQLYPANSTASLCAPGHVYNAVQKSTSDVRREYKRIFIEESDSEWSESVLNALILFKKALTLYFQSWKFVSKPGFPNVPVCLCKIKFHSAHSRVCGDWFFVNIKWLPVTDFSRAHSEIQYLSLYFINK